MFRDRRRTGRQRRKRRERRLSEIAHLEGVGSKRIDHVIADCNSHKFVENAYSHRTKDSTLKVHGRTHCFHSAAPSAKHLPTETTMVSSLEKGEERLALHTLLCQFIGDPQWGEEGRKRHRFYPEPMMLKEREEERTTYTSPQHRDSAYVAYASSP